MDNSPILFYQKNTKDTVETLTINGKKYVTNYFEFSNFYPLDPPVKIDSKEYPTTEHYYQSMKFLSEEPTKDQIEYAEEIRKCSSPLHAFYLGRKYVNPQYTQRNSIQPILNKYKSVRMREDWNEIKNNCMRKAVYQKFYQNEKLKELLLSTGNRKLVEHTPRDKWWADGGDGSGKNMLGIILMEVRLFLSCLTKLPLPFPNPPTKTSNWVIPNVLIASNDPSQNKGDIFTYMNEHIRLFVNLMESNELKETEEKYGLKLYEKEVDVVFKESKNFQCITKDDLMFVRMPIEDRRILKDNIANILCDCLCLAISKEVPILIHCRGGKGRTGVLCGIVLGKLYGMNYKVVCDILKSSFDYRIEKGPYPTFPQTKIQFSQMKRIIENM